MGGLLYRQESQVTREYRYMQGEERKGEGRREDQ